MSDEKKAIEPDNEYAMGFSYVESDIELTPEQKAIAELIEEEDLPLAVKDRDE